MTSRERIRTGRLSRLATAALLVVAPAAVVQTAAVAPPAYAIDQSKGLPGYCPNANGVTVVIDFQELGGTTIVRCAPGDQATGHAALKNAGIQIAGTNRWGESFICRIEGKPGPNSESCINTPPVSAYWSYWHSPNSGQWEYSQWGVMNRKPPLGSFEGWSFSKDKTATTNPSPRIAPVRPAPKPTPPPVNSSGGNSGGSSSGSVVPPPAGNGGSSSGGSAPPPAGDMGASSGGAVPSPPNNGGTNGGSGGTSASGGNTGGTGAATSGSGTAGQGAAGAATGTPDPGTPPASTGAPAPAATDPFAAGPGVAGNPQVVPDETAGATDQSVPPATAGPAGVAENSQAWTGGEELADTGSDSGLNAPTVAGFAALLALCAAAATVVRRRRAAAEGPPVDDLVTRLADRGAESSSTAASGDTADAPVGTGTDAVTAREATPQGEPADNEGDVETPATPGDFGADGPVEQKPEDE